MGRMLDALRKVGSAAPRPTAGASAAAAPPAEPTVEPAGDEAMPFIEVGGPRKTFSASPDVLAVPMPRPVPRAAASGSKPALAPTAAVGATPVEASAWSVQFRPMGRETPTSPVPMRHMAAELIAFHQPEHAATHQYGNLLTGLLAQCPSGWGQVLLFTSPAPWGGTTTVLLNLAVVAARQEGRRVAVVDANFRRPALGERLGLAPAAGLREVLSGSKLLPQVMQETAQKNLWALPAGRPASIGDGPVPLDWLMPTLRQLRQQFDLVFVDAASWNEGSEVSALAATCDAVYMVLNQAPGTPPENGAALPPLRQPPSNLQGCILTVR